MANISVEAVDRNIVYNYAHRIPWDGYIGAGRTRGEAVFIDEDDVRAIKRFGLENQDAMVELLNTDEDAKRYPHALLKVLVNITDVRILQFALTLIEDFISYDPVARAKYFTRPGASVNDKRIFLLPFLQLVGTSGSGARMSSLDANSYILERAALCASYLLSVDCSDAQATSSMLAWVMTHIKQYGSSAPRQVKVTEVAVTALMVLLRHDFLRTLFVEENGVERLVPMLLARNAQLLYEALFCLWTLSLTPAFASVLERAGTVTAVAKVLRLGMPIKVLRMGVATAVNVAKQPETADDALAEMCETHVPGVVEGLLAGQDGKVADQELADDLSWLRDALKSNRRKLTSIERYEKDLQAKRFEWVAAHSADFWKENATKFEQDGFRLIKQVADLLQDPATDDTTLAVALSDLGEFAVQHPQGRAVLQSLGVRPVVMSLLKREADDEVKAQALLACSKMLVTRWEFVGQSPVAAKQQA